MKLRKFNLSRIAIITAIIIALILIVVNFLSDDVDKKCEEMLDNIYKAAFEYKKTNNTQSLVIADKVYCVDSDNNKLQNPGSTRTSKCSGE